MLAEKKRSALIGIVGGLALQVVAYAVLVVSPSLMLLLVAALIGLIGFVMLMYGSAAFASGKGYAGWLGALLVFLLSWVGLVILAVLPDRMKHGTMATAPVMAPAGAYGAEYGAAPYDPSGYGAPDPAYGGLPVPAPVATLGTSGAYATADPFGPYAAPPAPNGGNGYGAPVADGHGGNGNGVSTFDQPAPEFQWEPSAQPAATPARAVAPAVDDGYALPPLPYDAPAYATPTPATAIPPVQPSNQRSDWPPAGHWSITQQA